MNIYILVAAVDGREGCTDTLGIDVKVFLDRGNELEF